MKVSPYNIEEMLERPSETFITLTKLVEIIPCGDTGTIIDRNKNILYQGELIDSTCVKLFPDELENRTVLGIYHNDDNIIIEIE